MFKIKLTIKNGLFSLLQIVALVFARNFHILSPEANKKKSVRYQDRRLVTILFRQPWAHSAPISELMNTLIYNDLTFFINTTLAFSSLLW